jgi:hypothetical protein
LENCSDTAMIFNGIISPDIDAVDKKMALVKVQNA